MVTTYNHELVLRGVEITDNNNFTRTMNIKWLWQLQFLIVLTCYTGISYYTVGGIYTLTNCCFCGCIGVPCHLVDGCYVQS